MVAVVKCINIEVGSQTRFRLSLACGHTVDRKGTPLRVKCKECDAAAEAKRRESLERRLKELEK